ncbi:MAG TPA: MFS transporter [Spirochaetia bacterium]
MRETRLSPRRDPEAALWKNLPRNVTGMLLFEFVWGFGLPFGLYASMVPAYLTVLGTSKSLMGFVQSFWTILIPLQLLGGYFFSTRNRMRSVIVLYMLATGTRWLYDLLTVLVPGMWTQSSLIVFFIVANLSYVGLLLLGQSLYMGVLTDNIPVSRRGWIFGLRTLGNGLGGVALGFAASWVLHHWPSATNFRVSFLICDTFWTLSSLSLFLVRDKPARRRRRGAAAGFFPALAAKTRVLLSNPNYRIFVFFQMLNSVALTITGFIIPYATERLKVSDDRVAWLSVIYIASNVGGVLLGRLADKAGYRLVGAVQSLLLVAFYMTAVASRSFAAICAAWTLYSVVNISSGFVLLNMGLELCPSVGASDLTALGGTFLLPFVAVATPLAGSIIDHTGSYLAVFFVGVTISIVALIGFAILVREPRTGRLYEIRQITQYDTSAR